MDRSEADTFVPNQWDRNHLIGWLMKRHGLKPGNSTADLVKRTGLNKTEVSLLRNFEKHSDILPRWKLLHLLYRGFDLTEEQGNAIIWLLTRDPLQRGLTKEYEAGLAKLQVNKMKSLSTPILPLAWKEVHGPRGAHDQTYMKVVMKMLSDAMPRKHGAGQQISVVDEAEIGMPNLALVLQLETEESQYGEARVQIRFPAYYTLPQDFLERDGFYPRGLAVGDRPLWKAENLKRHRLFKERIEAHGTGERQILSRPEVEQYLERNVYTERPQRIRHIQNLLSLIDNPHFPHFKIALTGDRHSESFILKGKQAYAWTPSQPGQHPRSIRYLPETEEAARWFLFFTFEKNWENLPNDSKNPKLIKRELERLVEAYSYK